MIEIKCTKSEQALIYDMFIDSCCPFPDEVSEGRCKQYDDCAECIEANVKFEVLPDVGTVYVPAASLRR